MAGRTKTAQIKSGLFSGRKRALWKGNISFALVKIPVSFYSLYIDRRIKLNMLCGKCFTPLKDRRWCWKCEREVPRDEVVKGYKIAENEYVVITKEDLDMLPLKSVKNIDILQFVASHELDPLYFDKSYYILPEKGGERAYFTILEAMQTMGRAAIGKLTFRNKEELVLLRPYKNGLIFTVLHYQEEIVDLERIPELIKKVQIEKEEMRLAKELIDRMTREFDLTKYRNTYLDAFRELIEHKVSGKEITKATEIKKAKSLTEALRISVEKIGEGQSD